MPRVQIKDRKRSTRPDGVSKEKTRRLWPSASGKRVKDDTHLKPDSWGINHGGGTVPNNGGQCQWPHTGRARGKAPDALKFRMGSTNL